LSIDSTSVLVKFTWYGDATINGQVDVDDLGLAASNWQMSGSWSEGDFDHTGFVDVNDLRMLATNWQAGVGNLMFGPGDVELSTLLQALALYPPLLEAAWEDPYLSYLLQGGDPSGWGGTRSIPEPTSATVLHGVLGLSRRRRGS
jgi:hypothetical protein